MVYVSEIQPFILPNYIKVDGPAGDSKGIDVGYLFKKDEDAEKYWEIIKAKWLEHVRHRRKWLEDIKRAEDRSAND